jgi:hypothetical protein
MVVLALVAICLPSVVDGSSDYDGQYTGTIRCDVLPGQTVEQLRTDFSLKVTDGKAEYQREILQPTNRSRLGVTERGSGTVSAAGEVVLTGSAAGQTWSYQADYRGQFDKNTINLSGRQLWRLSNRPEHARPCTIAVSRTRDAR